MGWERSGACVVSTAAAVRERERERESRHGMLVVHTFCGQLCGGGPKRRRRRRERKTRKIEQRRASIIREEEGGRYIEVSENAKDEREGKCRVWREVAKRNPKGTSFHTVDPLPILCKLGERTSEHGNFSFCPW